VFWFSLQLLPKIFPILRRIQQDIIINVHRSLVKYLSFLSYYNPTWISLTGFQKKYSNIKFGNTTGKNRVVPCKEAGRQMDKWTDMTKLRATFWNFVNMPTSNDTAQHYASLVSVTWSSVTVMKMLTFHLNNQSGHKFNKQNMWKGWY
jgi:hypothetical protein